MSDTPRCSLLILDLDNTLWDWVGAWHNGFKNLLHTVQPLLQNSEQEVFLHAVKEFHQTQGTSEAELHPLTLKPFNAKHFTDDVAAMLRSASCRRRAVQHEATKLYPGVESVLRNAHADGVKIVACTESRRCHTRKRLQKFNIESLFARVYCRGDTSIETSPATTGDWRYRILPDSLSKPDPSILHLICNEMGIAPRSTLYVGDSLQRDVAMAQQAGVLDVHAEYGQVDRQSDAYRMLERVTHWKPNSVIREHAIHAKAPTYTLSASLDQLPSLVLLASDTQPQSNSIPEAERLKLVVEAWKQSVQTQQHFNDLQLRIRSFGVTLIAAVGGGVGIALKEHYSFVIAGREISLAVVFCLAGAAGLVALFHLDYGYYKLLLGAVKHGQKIEHAEQAALSALKLAHTIRDESPTPSPFLMFLPSRFDPATWDATSKNTVWWLFQHPDSTVSARFSSEGRGFTARWGCRLIRFVMWPILFVSYLLLGSHSSLVRLKSFYWSIVVCMLVLAVVLTVYVKPNRLPFVWQPENNSVRHSMP